jgi:hypothetical protein
VIAETVVSVKSMTKWKTAKNPENWKPVTEFVKDRTRKTQKTQNRFYAVENPDDHRLAD